MRVSRMRDVTRAKIPILCGAIWRTILNFYASQGVWVNCYRIQQKSLNFIYPFKFYSHFTNKNVSWLHFSWATQYTLHSFGLCLIDLFSRWLLQFRPGSKSWGERLGIGWLAGWHLMAVSAQIGYTMPWSFQMSCSGRGQTDHTENIHNTCFSLVAVEIISSTR